MLPEDNIEAPDDAEIDAAAAANAPAPPAPVAPPSDADLLAAFDKGAALAGKQPDVDELPTAKPVESEKPAEAAKPADPAKSEKVEEIADPDADAKAAIEAEIAEYGLKAKAAERFRSLTGRIKELESAKPDEAAANEAQTAIQFRDMVIDTGAPPEQVGAVLGYLAAVNSGDPAKLEMGFNALKQELTNLAKVMGKPLDLGDVKVDPLEEHPDLQEEVANGEIDRKRALEIAQYRLSLKRVEQSSQAVAAQTQADQAKQASISAVAQWAQATRAAGPDLYDAKMALLKPSIAMIQENLPPDKWPLAIANLFNQTPAPVVAAPPKPAAPRPTPLRPTGVGTQGMDRKPTNDLDAFDMGLQVARQRGL